MDEEKDKVEKLLSEPMFADMTDNELKIRRNLLIVSFISIFVSVSGIHIDESVVIWGITFKYLTPDKIYFALWLICFYLFLHFSWISIHIGVELTLRARGARNSISMYKWWFNEIREVNNLILPTKTVIEHCEKLKAVDVNNKENIDAVLTSSSNIQNYLKRMTSLAETPFFQNSLKNYDKWYIRFINSQNLRWIIIEIGLPIIMGLVTLVLLGSKMC